MDYIYDAWFQPDPEGGFLVTFPDVPEAITAGDDEAEARRNAVEALGLALRGLLAHGRSLPVPGKPRKGHVRIAVDPEDALKLALVEAFARSGLSKSEFARRLGKADTEGRRILDPDHPTKLGVMQAALAVLGKAVIVSVRDAA